MEQGGYLLINWIVSFLQQFCFLIYFVLCDVFAPRLFVSVCNTKDHAGNKYCTFACHPLDYCFYYWLQKRRITEQSCE